MNTKRNRIAGDVLVERLDELETQRNLTQREVAEAIGMPEQTYSNKKNRTGRSFTLKDMNALADFFDTSVDYLMGRTLDPWPVDTPQAEGVAS